MRPGYRLTEVGVIPDEWDALPLGGLQPFVTSGSRGWATFYSERGALFVRITNLSRQSIYLDLRDPRFVALPPDVSEGVRTRLKEHDVLISITADIGIVGFVDASVPTPAYINQHIALVRLDPAETCGKFISYFLASEKPQKLFRASTDTGAKAGMSLATVLKIQMALPPVLEQRAIAAALSDVDALLGGLDRLIAKKRDLKQAAMQQLLTGRTRLPDFRDKWEVKRLGEVGSFLKGSGVKKDEAQTGNLPCIRYGEIYTHHNDIIKSFNSWISAEVAATATRLKQGDLLFAGSGETKEEIGKCVAFVNDFEAYAGGDTVILRLADADAMFMGYYCNTAPINAQKATKGQGDAVVHISAAALSTVVVVLPSVREQSAIATVLADMDAELSALEARRDKTRALKQAMMQELLTGKTRLVETHSNVIAVDFAATSKPTAAQQPAARPHNWAINEAVVVSMLVKQFGSEQYPLGRKRCTKLAYLLHRHVEHMAEGYLKKAAGPYNPAVKYKGPEGIAQKNGYIRAHSSGKFSGFVAAEKIAQAEDYFDKWYGHDVSAWLEQFRFSSNDELELLTTVDMAAEDLRRATALVNVLAVHVVIHGHPEWEAKLERETFSEANIARAIHRVSELFPVG
jgi:type I restriction enzyme, S subunit